MMNRSFIASSISAGVLIALLAAAPWARTITGPRSRRRIASARRTPTPTADAASLADLKWFEVFKDEKLQELERTALAQNYDLRDAVARVEAARANLGITRSNQFPHLGAGANISTIRLSRDGADAPARVVRALAESHLRRSHAQPAFVRSGSSGAGCAAPPKPRAPIC